jgi:hypothetical protein
MNDALVAAVRAVDPVGDRATFDRQWGVLLAALAGPLPAAMHAWATELADQGDALPLLGLSLRGPHYEALLWNGARCPEAAVLITGLLTAPPETTTADLAAAVAAGVRVNEALRLLAPPGPARLSLATIGCAVTAGMSSSSVDTIIDLAASLMVFSSAVATGGSRTDLLRAGHPVASGWLATRLLAAEFAPMAGGLAATLAAAGGQSTAPVATTVSGLLDAVR